MKINKKLFAVTAFLFGATIASYAQVNPHSTLYAKYSTPYQSYTLESDDSDDNDTAEQVESDKSERNLITTNDKRKTRLYNFPVQNVDRPVVRKTRVKR